jgi:ribosomal protein S18 acetylase RimI-like enzyme
MVTIRRLGPADVNLVMAASPLFDEPARRDAAERFLASPIHHLLLALDDGAPVGFVSGVETTHPDKGTELFLYELAVDPRAQRRGIGAALVAALRDLALELGCHGMWVLTDADNEAALATYRKAGSGEPSSHVLLEWRFPPSAGDRTGED